MALFDVEEVAARPARPRRRRRASASSATWTPASSGSFRLRLKDTGRPRRGARRTARRHTGRLDAADPRGADPQGRRSAMSTDDIAAKRGIGYCAERRRDDARSSTRRLPTPPSCSARPRSSRSVPSPPRARRCRRSRPTSSRSSSPGSSSTRSSLAPSKRPVSSRPWSRSTRARATTAPPASGTAAGCRRPTLRTDAYGTIDEAGSALGVARSLCRADNQADSTPTMLSLQQDLFVAGAELATAPEAADRLEDGVSRITDEMVEASRPTSTATWTRWTSRRSSSSRAAPSSPRRSMSPARDPPRRAERGRAPARRRALPRTAVLALPQSRLGPRLRDGPLRRRAQPALFEGREPG